MPDRDGHSEAHREHRPGAAGWRDDLATCLMFLTRLPVAGSERNHDRPLGGAMRAFGLAGAVVGAITAIVLATALALGFNPVLASLAALAAATLLTGALHEDGLGDVADGFGGGATRERKLEIMRDSRIGAYGVLALVFTVGARIFALATIVERTTPLQAMCLIVAIAVASRAAMGWMMATLPNARSDGRAAEAGRPTPEAIRQLMIASLIIAAPLTWWSIGAWGLIVAVAAVCLVALAFKRISAKQIGGQTGDVLGATQQLTELGLLLTLAALIG